MRERQHGSTTRRVLAAVIVSVLLSTGCTRAADVELGVAQHLGAAATPLY